MDEQIQKKLERILEENKDKDTIVIEDPEIVAAWNKESERVAVEAARRCKKWSVNPRTLERFCIEYE